MTPWRRRTLNNRVYEDHWGPTGLQSGGLQSGGLQSAGYQIWISLGTYRSGGPQSGGLQSGQSERLQSEGLQSGQSGRRQSGGLQPGSYQTWIPLGTYLSGGLQSGGLQSGGLRSGGLQSGVYSVNHGNGRRVTSSHVLRTGRREHVCFGVKKRKRLESDACFWKSELLATRFGARKALSSLRKLI